MEQSAQTVLRNLLTRSYDDLVRRLSVRLGSSELAREALQDTYLRLDRPLPGPLRNPAAYLFRMALNAGRNRRAADARYLSAGEVEALAYIPDEAPLPSAVVESRQELKLLTAALDELPLRRREIALAAWARALSHKEIAAEFGISVRTVQTEIKNAMEHCARRLKR